MSITAKLFMSGRSQAIRLPAKLRLAATEVQIEQMGTGLWIRTEPEPGKDMGVWLKDFYASTEALPDNFLIDRQDLPAEQRDWSLS